MSVLYRIVKHVTHGFIYFQFASGPMDGCQFLQIANTTIETWGTGIPIVPTLTETWSWHGFKTRTWICPSLSTSVRWRDMCSFLMWMSGESFYHLFKLFVAELYLSWLFKMMSSLSLLPFQRCITWRCQPSEVSYLQYKHFAASNIVKTNWKHEKIYRSIIICCIICPANLA